MANFLEKKMAVSFANIFMMEIETKLIQRSEPSKENGNVTLMTFSPFGIATEKVDRFIKRANHFHPAVKFTAEISENENTFLNTTL